MSRSSHLLPLINEAISDKNILMTIENNSYRHVGHFDKIVLVEGKSEDNFQLSLYLWDPFYTNIELADDLIHDHRSDFWSIMVAGTLRIREFCASNNGVEFQAYSSMAGDALKETFYTYSGPRRLQEKKLIKIGVGDTYFFDYSTIHEIIFPHNCSVCTLVLRGPQSRRYRTVYNTTRQQPKAGASDFVFSKSSLSSRLLKLRHAIEMRRLLLSS